MWIFRYPKEKWNKNCVEEAPRKGESKIGQMMMGLFLWSEVWLFPSCFS